MQRYRCIRPVRSLLLHTIVFFAVCGTCFAEGLVDGLGDESYEKRAAAAERLRGMGFGALKILRENFNNEDIEISLRSREIYEEYFDVGLTKGEYPSIWFLDPRHRFPRGYSVEFNSKRSLCKLSCPKDVSKDYYLKAKILMGIPHFDPDCDGGWRVWTASQVATRMLARDVLMAGGDKKKVVSMVLETKDNQARNDLMFATEDLEGRTWDFWRMPPGLMVDKQDFVFPSY